jgi:hypothetical protein
MPVDDMLFADKINGVRAQIELLVHDLNLFKRNISEALGEITEEQRAQTALLRILCEQGGHVFPPDSE